jgi:hypothetical protein
MSAPAHEHEDAPEVAALLKKARGEPLTAAEEAILARTYRKPDGPTVPHEEVMRELAERQRRGE